MRRRRQWLWLGTAIESHNGSYHALRQSKTRVGVWVHHPRHTKWLAFTSFARFIWNLFDTITTLLGFSVLALVSINEKWCPVENTNIYEHSLSLVKVYFHITDVLRKKFNVQGVWYSESSTVRCKTAIVRFDVTITRKLEIMMIISGCTPVNRWPV